MVGHAAERRPVRGPNCPRVDEWWPQLSGGRPRGGPDRNRGVRCGRVGADRGLRDRTTLTAMLTELVELPGGSFRMGSTRFYPEEVPVHTVAVAAVAVE